MEFTKNYKIGIVGLGFVGTAAKKYFQNKKIPTYNYDKYKKIGSPEKVNRADAIFVCVPTPYSVQSGFDLSFVRSAVAILSSSKIVIIKSSIIPGTTELLQKEFLAHKFLVNPEFLRETSAYADFTHPDRQILGYTAKSKSVAKSILGLLPGAPYKKIMPSGEAEMVKYMANSFLSLKVVFANEFYDLCKASGLDYEQVRLAVGADSRISPSHLDIAHDGYRGYGGSCFPKDVNALVQFAEKNKVPMNIVKAMRKINRKLLALCGLKEEYFLTKQHKKNI